jgi:hypothetical protein
MGGRNIVTDRSIVNTPTGPEDVAARSRARLVRLQLEVLACPPSEARSVLLAEIAAAQEQLAQGDPTYAKYLYDQTASLLVGLKLRRRFDTGTPESAVGVLLLGVVTYSAGVLLFIGPCVVVVSSLSAGETNSFTAVAKAVGLLPLFETVMRLKIQPDAYLWGLFGGAGAVVSMARRFEQIAKHPTPFFWVLFGQGLFNPIVGSLSAVVVCGFVYKTDQLKVLQFVPAIVIAFFAGFSERLLARTEALLGGLSSDGGKGHLAEKRSEDPSKS